MNEKAIIDKKTGDMLMNEAVKARRFAYAPYSKFYVGAALLTAGGKVYTGCNIENAAYGPGNCAERTAIFKAVSEGEKGFTAIAIVGGSGEEPAEFCAPCGICRQVMAEFCMNKPFSILLGTPESWTAYSFDEILPFAFGPADLK